MSNAVSWSKRKRKCGISHWPEIKNHISYNVYHLKHIPVEVGNFDRLANTQTICKIKPKLTKPNGTTKVAAVHVKFHIKVEIRTQEQLSIINILFII